MPKYTRKIKFNAEIFARKIEEIRDRMPDQLDGLIKSENNVVKGLYKTIEGEIISLLKEIRKAVIENHLLSKDELEILEHVYERFKGEFYLGEVIDQLKEIVQLDVKRLQDVIVELSKKGMITVKLFVE
jgi:hypothetical protein